MSWQLVPASHRQTLHNTVILSEVWRGTLRQTQSKDPDAFHSAQNVHHFRAIMPGLRA